MIGEAEKDAGLYHAISDFYLDFVRSGAISVSSGRLQSLSGRVASVVPLRTSTDTEIKDVAAVVLATGFEATSSVSYLPAAVLEILQTAPGDLNDTFALAFHNTYHPAVPNLGFVGFYRAPYWGVMEGQARFVAELLAAGGPSSPSLRPAMRKAVEEDTGIEDTLRVRAAPGSLQPQFPMANCVAIVDRLAKTLGVPRLSHTRVLPKAGPNPMDIITPARYLSKRATAEQSAESRASLQALEMAVGDDTGRRKFVARAVFRSLLGTWRLQREVASKLATHPSGQFTGTAEFLLRQGTREGRAGGFAADVAADGDPGLEYLYVERGTFKARDGTWFPATQRYVWRWDDEKDAISVWFVKPDDRKRVDYLFHEVKFQPAVNYEANSDSGDSGCGMPLFGGWPAKGKHLCVEDMYDVEYLFTFKQVVLERIQLDYYVKGPKKDYTLTGWYSR